MSTEHWPTQRPPTLQQGHIIKKANRFFFFLSRACVENPATLQPMDGRADEKDLHTIWDHDMRSRVAHNEDSVWHLTIYRVKSCKFKRHCFKRMFKKNKNKDIQYSHGWGGGQLPLYSLRRRTLSCTLKTSKCLHAHVHLYSNELIL